MWSFVVNAFVRVSFAQFTFVLKYFVFYLTESRGLKHVIPRSVQCARVLFRIQLDIAQVCFLVRFLRCLKRMYTDIQTLRTNS